MADDFQSKGQQDRSRINVNEEWEVAYWTKELGVSKEQLADAVKTVGPAVTAVRQHLGK